MHLEGGVIMEKYLRKTFMWEGKRYERKGKTPEELYEKIAELKAQLRRGEVGISGNMTVASWADEWLETYKRPSVGEGSYKNYAMHVNNIIIPAIGTTRLKDVKDVHLQKILNSRAGKSKSDLSKLRMTMAAMFKRAYVSQLIMRNPAENLTLPAAKEGTHRSITEYERAKILELCETHRAGLWVRMLLYCGLRPGETRALEWRHIDFEKKLIYVRGAMKAGTNVIGAPKSAAGERDVPIPEVLLTCLAKDKADPFTPVFKQPVTGNYHTKASMRRLWLSFKRELDISMGAKLYRNQITVSVVAADLAPYCLRHTYCTDLQDAGVPINIAKYLMGHSDISITAKIYTHTTEQAIQDAAEKINRHHA